MAGRSRERTLGRVGRRRLFVALVVAALAVIPAAIAWACNPQAQLTTNQTSYSPGEPMTVSGSFFPRSTAIRISVESGGSATVTTTSNGAFRVSGLQAPSSPGTYTVTANKADGSFQSGLPKVASFAVQAPASAGTGPSGQAGAPAAQGRAPAFREPSVNRSRGTAVSRGGGTQRAERPTGGVGGGAGVVTAGGQTVFAGSAAPAEQGAFVSGGTATAAAPRQAAARGARGAGARQSDRSAASDVWSGFATSGKTPTLTNGVDNPEGGTGSQLGLGVGLLALGLVALVSGLAAAEARRRRALR